MKRVKPRWTVCKRDGQWRVYDHGIWSTTHDTLADAHTEATRNAVADVLYAPGGLTLLAEFKANCRTGCFRCNAKTAADRSYRL